MNGADDITRQTLLKNQGPVSLEVPENHFVEKCGPEGDVYILHAHAQPGGGVFAIADKSENNFDYSNPPKVFFANTIPEHFGLNTLGKKSILDIFMQEHEKFTNPQVHIAVGKNIPPIFSALISEIKSKNIPCETHESENGLLAVDLRNGVVVPEKIFRTLPQYTGNKGEEYLVNINSALNRSEHLNPPAFSTHSLDEIRLCSRPVTLPVIPARKALAFAG